MDALGRGYPWVCGRFIITGMNQQMTSNVGRADTSVPLLSRPVNWLSIIAAICVLLEGLMLWQYPVSSDHPPSVTVLILAMLALFVGAGALIHQVNVHQHPILGRWLGLLAMLGGVGIFAFSAINVRKGLEVTQHTRMREIVAACRMWAKQHHHDFPPDLSVLVRSGVINGTTLSDPTLELKSLVLPKNYKTMKPSLLSTLVRKNSDYRYTGAGLTHINRPGRKALLPQLIVLFVNDQEPVKPGPLAFADGKVRYISARQMPLVLAACNAARKKLGLLPINFDVATPVGAAAPSPHNK